MRLQWEKIYWNTFLVPDKNPQGADFLSEVCWVLWYRPFVPVVDTIKRMGDGLERFPWDNWAKQASERSEMKGLKGYLSKPRKHYAK